MDPHHLPRSAARPAPRAVPTARRIASYVAGALLLAGFIGVWGWHASARQRTLRELPLEERAALFERTESNVRSLCASRPDPSLDDFCTAQAELLLEFPECVGDCVALVESVRPRPVR